ncbi:acid-sensing ion channel 1 isoform X2 [Parasteatoda tepidariorum]|uniref:acid-sensing ion channel 1 isoform X2 n=1 Tax=Parasteatoda tepidariorum TaxID=114398 RepID=UPI0039BCB502
MLMNYTDFCRENFYFCNTNYEFPENVTFPVITPYGLPQKNREYFRSFGSRDTDLIESCQIIFPTFSRSCVNNKTILVDVFDSMGLPNNCYTINSFVGEVQTKIKKIPSKTYVNIKIKTSVKDTFYTATPAVFQISIHNPRVLVNPFKKGISVKPCFNYYLYPSKVVNILMSAPYDTNCTDYFEEWVARGGVGPLSQTCREECLLNATLEDSHCVDPFYIAYPNTAPICNQPVYGNKYFKKCLHLCSRACYREDILIDVEEHASLLARENKDEADECISVLTIAFSRMEVKTFRYSAKYQGIEMFGNIGGILGVWLGISLMAITDVFETCYVVFRHFRKRIHRKKIKKELIKAEKLFQDCYHCDSKGNFTLKIY